MSAPAVRVVAAPNVEWTHHRDGYTLYTVRCPDCSHVVHTVETDGPVRTPVQTDLPHVCILDGRTYERVGIYARDLA